MLTDMEHDSPQVVMKPPYIFLIGIAAALLLDAGTPLPLMPTGYDALALVSGAVLVVLGLGLMFWSVSEFRRAGTSPRVKEPSTAIVRTGPFRHTRNPMYVGMTLVAVGAALLFDTRWILLALIPVLLTIRYGVIEREESYLEAKFGQAYRDYKASVRRWL